MFDRFTDESIQVLRAAREEASNVPVIHAHHLLLGLLRERDKLGVLQQRETRATHLLRKLGISPEEVCGELPAHTAYTSKTKKVLELSMREALQVDAFVGPEHLLVGLLREEESRAAHVLTEFGAELAALRNEVVRLTWQHGDATRQHGDAAGPHSAPAASVEQRLERIESSLAALAATLETILGQREADDPD